MKRVLSILFATLLVASCTRDFTPGFAIVIDAESYSQAKSEIDQYQELVKSRGLQPILVVDRWGIPDSIRAELIRLYDAKDYPIEGCVFIGDIPIARTRDAQHMTTAFKMNETKFDRSESWVATDRFYDDLDLEWRYCDRDTADTGVFYYHLTDQGAQRVAPEVYSARMQVPDCFGDKYQRLNDYLAEVVKAHSEVNYLDNVIYYGGSGYNGDCLSLWRQKPIAWKE